MEEKPIFEPFIGALPAFNTKLESRAWIREMRGDDPEEDETHDELSED